MENNRNQNLSIVGAGTVGSAVGRLLAGKGYRIRTVHDLEPERARRLAEAVGAVPVGTAVEAVRGAEIVFLTCNDTALAGLAQELADQQGFRPGQIVLHMSGALGSDVLAPAAAAGAGTMAVHPLQSFASSEEAMRILPGSIFSLEGEETVRQLVESIVADLGGIPFGIAGSAKPLYHAGACVASNYLVTLAGIAVDLLAAAGIPREMCLPALLPLMEGTLSNLKTLGIPRALTGPIARGDTATIDKHLIGMEGLEAETVRLYRELGLKTVQLAVARGGISAAQAEAMTKLLSSGKR